MKRAYKQDPDVGDAQNVSRLKRRTIISLSLGAVGCLSCEMAYGQAFGTPRLLCDFVGFNSNSLPQFIAEGVPDAYQAVWQIQRAIGFPARIRVMQAAGGNAFAVVLPPGVPVIGYNPNFFNWLHMNGGPAAPISVLGHEVGHHANGDTTWRGTIQHPWGRELGADFVSGFALARLGAGPEEATRALRLMFSVIGSASHPDTPRRIAAVVAGWSRGGGSGGLAF